MLRRAIVVVCATTLLVTAGNAQDKTSTPSIEDDLKRLTATRWLNEKPEASWDKLTDEQKGQVGGKPWKKVELEIAELRVPKTGFTHSLSRSFFKLGEDTSNFGITSGFEVRGEQGKRFMVLTNVDKVQYRIQYEFQGNKLRVRGTYVHIEPGSGFVFIPEIFDGEYVQVPRNKK